MLKQPSLEKLCCPECRGDLELSDGADIKGIANREMRCRGCERRFAITDGYADFLGSGGLGYSGTREKIIRSLYAKAYTPLTNLMFIVCGGAGNARDEVLSHLCLKDGCSVLETGVGAGENLKWMNDRSGELDFYAIDIQHIMLQKSISNINRWKIGASLCRADAHKLPFRDDLFDIVFHLGAINLFEDKGKAISEMIRVAKKGTHLVIADETEKAGKLFRLFTGSNERNDPPMEFIPDGVKDISLSTIWRGYGYLVEFTKC